MKFVAKSSSRPFAEELPRLDELHRRGVANGLQGLEIIGRERLEKDRTPRHRYQSPLCAGNRHRRLQESRARPMAKKSATMAAISDCRSASSAFSTGPHEIVLQTSGGDYRTRHLINCCGLQSDIVAQMIGGANRRPARRAPHHSVSRRILQNCAGAANSW